MIQEVPYQRQIKMPISIPESSDVPQEQADNTGPVPLFDVKHDKHDVGHAFSVAIEGTTGKYGAKTFRRDAAETP